MSSPSSVRIAVVLYENPLAEVWRCVRAVNRSAQLALDAPEVGLNKVVLAIGDCSDVPVISEGDLRELRAGADPRVELEYTFFRANLGHSAGSNALAEGALEDAVLFLNPDSYVAPTLLRHLVEALRDPEVVAADGRQIPCEHPKHFDPRLGDQSWASGACLVVRSADFHAVGGFDARWFPSYVNDVDLSWRLRMRGKRVVHQPRAVLFHDKRLDAKAGVRTTAIEPYEGILGRLMLATRFDRPDIVTETVDVLEVHGSDEQRRALEEYQRRHSGGDLPPVLPDAASVADFINGEYGRRRF
ncbi:MAG TPA: glycosyltransferase [Umezawaea sp.]|nr:glycosyltransferase [Umezawaea sp.]